MKNHCFLLFFLLAASFKSHAQKYWVFFTDKQGVSFNPYEYFDEKAIERRHKHGVSLFDSSDFPVKEEYLKSIEILSDEILVVSRWLNCAVVNTDKERAEIIRSFDFVRSVNETQSIGKLAIEDTDSTYRLAESQIKLMQGNLFQQNNITGKGVRVAIFDAGFPGVDENEVFLHINERSGIVATYDFVSKNENVFRRNQHGAMVLSCIAGKLNSQILGMATDAEFLLARTESVLSENLTEEENWLAAAEWADKNGAQIINSSLGYTYQRHFQSDLDGSTSFITKAANIAASKGILVVNSAGNEGSGNWVMLGAPGDADSVLTVGALNPWTTLHEEFGSYGPTYDGRLKPNVIAPSTVIAMGKKSIVKVDGTSFSSPLTAGFAACLMQMYPEKTNMEIFRLIEKSAHLYPYYDYAHGYGVPQAGYFFRNSEDSTRHPTFKVDLINDTVKISIMNDYFEKTHALSHTFSPSAGITHPEIYFDPEKTRSSTLLIPYFYYHIYDKGNQKIESYKVLTIEDQEFKLPHTQGNLNNKILRLFYKGYVEEVEF